MAIKKATKFIFDGRANTKEISDAIRALKKENENEDLDVMIEQGPALKNIKSIEIDREVIRIKIEE